MSRGTNRRRRWHLLAAGVVLTSGVGGSWALADHEQRVLDEVAAERFDRGSRAVADAARVELDRYEDLLLALQDLHRSARSVSPVEFRDFTTNFASERRYPGLQGMALLFNPRGVARDMRPAVVYVEPRTADLTVLGFDPGRRSALLETAGRAVTTGEPALSPPQRLFGEDDAVGYVLYAPLWRSGARPQNVAERIDAAIGVAAVSFRADQFLSAAVTRGPGGVGAGLYDGAPHAGAHVSSKPSNYVPDQGRSRSVAVPAADRLWSLRLQPLTSDARALTAPDLVRSGGAALGALLAALVLALGRAKERALRLVDEAVGTLARSEERFRSLSASSPMSVFQLDASGACSYTNGRLLELTGRSADELAGDGLLATVHCDDREAARTAWMPRRGVPSSTVRLRVLRPDGTVRWVRTAASALESDAGWVGSLEDVTVEVAAQQAQERIAAELEHAAQHDRLTGLLNRMGLLAALDATDVARTAVLSLDIDRFKVVNDSLGHAAGDRLLIEVVARLEATLRDRDLASRPAGDEFVVVLDGTDEAGAVLVAERILSSLSESVTLDDHDFQVTASIGIAVGRTGESVEDLLVRADAALYQAKSRGKARWELDVGTAGAGTGSTLSREQDLRRAIDDCQLAVVYQPIADLSTGAIVGAEALVRWPLPDGRVVPPLEFIDLAEESGLIVPLGAFVLQESCRQLARWDVEHPQTARRIAMSVNASARQLADPRFVGTVLGACTQAGVDPGRLCIEVTEGALLRDVATAEAVLTALRAAGVRVAVDDFGTGYSSLTHLRQLPLDVVKVDRSFVGDRSAGAGGRAIVQAVVDMSRALGLRTVAEGVEDPEQLAWLSTVGCDMAQGYHLSRPVSGDAVARLLQDGFAHLVRSAATV